MTFRAVVKDGMVVIPASADIPDGVSVDIRVARERAVTSRKQRAKVKRPTKAKSRGNTKATTLSERLRSVIGSVKGLPRDSARNVDHYLYGAPKR